MRLVNFIFHVIIVNSSRSHSAYTVCSERQMMKTQMIKTQQKDGRPTIEDFDTEIEVFQASL